MLSFMILPITMKLLPPVINLLFLSSLPCLGVAKGWNGTNGNWSDASKWSPAGVPATGDDVTFPIAGPAGFTVSFDQNASVRNYLQLGETYGGTLAAVGARTLTVTGPMTWSGGRITGAMTVLANGGVTINPSGSIRQLGDSGTTAPLLVNAGTFNLNASFSVAGRSSGGAGPHAQITNNGVFNFNGTAGLFGSTAGNYPGIFQNNSTVNKTGTGNASISITFNNSGSVNVSAGTLSIGNGTQTAGSSFSTTGSGIIVFNSSRVLSTGVSISSAATGRVVFGSGTATKLNGATYSVAGTTEITGALEIDAPVTMARLEMTAGSGTRRGPQALTVNGPFIWGGGVLEGTGVTIANGGITFNGSTTKTLGGTGGVATRLVNSGTANLESGFTINRGGCEFLNDEIFNHKASSNINAGPSGSGALGKFTNDGQFIKDDVGTGTISTVFDNLGSVTLNRGRVNFAGGGTDVVGSYNVAVNGVLGFTGGTRTLNSLCSVTGAGEVVFSGGNTTFNNSSYDTTGRTTVSDSGMAIFNMSSALYKGKTRLLYMTGGTRGGNGLLEVTQGFTWTAGTLASSSSTTANGVVMSGSGTKYLGNGGSGVGASLQNIGAGSMSGDSQLIIAGTISPTLSGSRFWNHGSMTASGNMSIVSQSHGGTDGAFINSSTGSFIRSEAGTTNDIGVLFQNSGSVSVSGGTLSFSGGFRQLAGQLALAGGTVSGRLDILGGSLTGSGTINGNTDLTGQLAPGASPGLLSFAGNLTLRPGSTTSMEIGGRTRGTNHDAFNVSGSLALGGALTVSLIDSFQPVAGDSFVLWNVTGAKSGSFSSVNLPALSGGLSWDTSELASAGILKVSGGTTAFTYNDYVSLYSLTEGPGGDDDGDGLSNLMEFMLASVPNNRSSAPRLQLARSGNTTTITLDVPETYYDNVSLWIEASQDLSAGSWSRITEKPAGGTWSSPATLTAPISGRRTLQVLITGPDPKRFYRVSGSYP